MSRADGVSGSTGRHLGRARLPGGEEALAGGGRQKATTSFRLGLVRGIGTKLGARKAERDAKTFETSGRDDVPIEASVVEDESAKLGLSFSVKATNRGRMVPTGASEAGQIASGRFEIQSGST